MFQPADSTSYEFGEFRLEANSRRLFQIEKGEFVPLQPKAVELLLLLVQNEGRLLTKNTILDAVWAETIVEEANLSQTVFVLRKALGDNRKEPRFIVTIPNRGYRFMAPVRKIEPAGRAENSAGSAVLQNQSPDSKPPPAGGEKPPARRSKYLWLLAPGILLAAFGVFWQTRDKKPPALREIKSMAVLPFEDLSGGRDENNLGGGLADALVNKFGRLKQITVRPTRAVLKYTESRESAEKIGRELEVEAVLDGRIQRAGERVRVSVQLIRTLDNATLWSENFDEDSKNFFVLVDSISYKVAQSLALQMDEGERRRFERSGSGSAVANEEYMRGRFFWNKRTAESFKKAIEYFNRAVALDPNFALAHSALAETYVLLHLFSPTQDQTAFPLAKQAAARALEIDESLAEPHAALAQVKMQYEFDWAGTESEYLIALELNPNSPTVHQWYGEFLALQGRTGESRSQLERARELDPTSLSINTALALPSLVSGEADQAVLILDKVLEMDDDFAWALHYKGRALIIKGDYQGAVEIYRRAVAASDGSSYLKANLAFALALAGKPPEAREILRELRENALRNHVAPINFAIVHNALGEEEKVFEYLEKAVAERDFLVPTLLHLNFQNLRQTPRYREILQRANLASE